MTEDYKWITWELQVDSLGLQVDYLVLGALRNTYINANYKCITSNYIELQVDYLGL